MTKLIKEQLSQNSISRKLILYVVLFSSLLTLIITAAQLYYDYSVELDSIHQNLDQFESVHLETLTAAVWAVDRKNASVQLEGILEVPDMEYLEISENGKLWLKAGIRESKNILERTYPLIHTSRGQQRTIGQLKVIATLDRLYERLINKALTILLSNAMKTFLVAGFMLILFYQLVTRHILKIADFVQNHDINAQSIDHLALDRGSKHTNIDDELSILVNRLNEMQENINKSYTNIKVSEEKYRRLVELAQEGIWTIDENGATVFVNPAMANMLGYSVDEMNGKHLFDFMDEQGKLIAQNNMERRRSGIQENHDFELLRKDGQRIYTSMATAPIYDSEGNYIGAIAGVMDITERIMAEKNLRDYQKKLEDTVQERTKALAASNKELEAFSYSVAHDLRTPLRSITSFSQILQEEEEDKLSQEGKNILDRIIQAGKGMSQLIDELLELSRISRTEISSVKVNLSQISENIINQLIVDNPHRKCKITIAENLSTIADKTLMEVLLQNLIQNAWKFTQDNELSDIEVGDMIQDGQRCFYVKDNGVGFDMKYKHKLFEAFQRLHGADYSGNGIGLATVKRIVTRHGGNIWAQARENSGATFYFTIPDKPTKHSVVDKIKAIS